MSAKPMHLNLLDLSERRSSSPVRFRVLFPIAAGIACAFVALWGGFLFVQLLLADSQIDDLRADIASLTGESVRVDTLKAKHQNLQAEDDQFSFYEKARQTRGKLLEKLAFAIPRGITLTALTIPPPPAQNLKPPAGSRLPPLQGTTQTVERVELRLTGRARAERDVFELMNALKGKAFTNDVIIAEEGNQPESASPRVLTFRQDIGTEGDRAVLFDIVYQIRERRFEK